MGARYKNRMHWSPQPAAGLPDLILFDGDCVLCSRWARWIDRRDAGRRFRFVAIQSEAGEALARRFAVRPHDPETNIVVLEGLAYFKLDAAWAVFRALGMRGWSAALRAPPPPLRHWLYDRIARNRYRLFGRRASCLAPSSSVRARLIEREAELVCA